MKTLREMKQQIFNIVVLGLLAQMEKCLVPENSAFSICQYRGVGEDGRKETKCAAGMLISDKLYTKDLEGATVFDFDPDIRDRFMEKQDRIWQVILESQNFEYIGHRENYYLRGFVRDLQTVHDYVNPCNWQNRLTEIGVENGLTMPEIPV